MTLDGVCFSGHRLSSLNSPYEEVSKENMKPPPQCTLLEDRISVLPTDTLVDILSKLKMKEAAVTSVLSRIWSHMWTRVYNLDFDGLQVLADVQRKIKSFEVELPIYVRCVSEALRHHQGHTIDQFVVRFCLDDRCRSDIDRWVDFAVRKRVKILELDFQSLRCFQKVYYRFLDCLETSSCRSLTSLHLAMVDITGEMLEHFLRNCLNLERVYVSHSRALLSLNVNGPSLKLKWLDLFFCHKMECLNVSAPNLVSFEYSGRIIPMPLKDVPKLLNLSIDGLYGCYINSRLSELSSCLSLLEKLTLGACIDEKHMKPEGFRFPVFSKLTHLTLIATTFVNETIIDYASLINACPSLYYFSFQSWNITMRPRKPPFKGEALSPNTKIREVALQGFRSCWYEVEMANYLIENAVMLEKITFDVSIPLPKGKVYEFYQPNEGEIAARESARETARLLFRRKVQPGVELVIV